MICFILLIWFELCYLFMGAPNRICCAADCAEPGSVICGL